MALCNTAPTIKRLTNLTYGSYFRLPGSDAIYYNLSWMGQNPKGLEDHNPCIRNKFILVYVDINAEVEVLAELPTEQCGAILEFNRRLNDMEVWSTYNPPEGKEEESTIEEDEY